MAIVEEINDDDAPPSSPNHADPNQDSGFLGSLANSIFEVSLPPLGHDSRRYTKDIRQPGVNKSLFQGPVLSLSFLPI